MTRVKAYEKSVKVSSDKKTKLPTKKLVQRKHPGYKLQIYYNMHYIMIISFTTFKNGQVKYYMLTFANMVKVPVLTAFSCEINKSAISSFETVIRLAR